MKMHRGLIAAVLVVVVGGSLTMNSVTMAQINSHDNDEEIETQPVFYQSDNGDEDNPCSPLDTNAPTNYMTSYVTTPVFVS